MHKRILFCLVLVICGQTQALRSQSPNPNSLVPYVNPFIGTGGHGHTYPGATAPFGLVQLSPDTRIDMMDWDGCSGYHYSDSIIYGFSHTHLSGTGVADYCDILFMPYTGGAALEPKEYASKFKKTREKAEAGYYSVFLEKDRIKAELTATERTGVHRYTFPGNRERGHILIDLRHRDEVLDSYMKRVNDREIEGYRISKAWAKEQHVYFVARFSRPFHASRILDMSKSPRETAPSVTGKAVVGLLDFYNDSGPLVVVVGISGTSIEGARKNLEAECDHFDFEKIKAETQAKWQRQLSKIEVEGGTDDQKTIFYTALYHTMIVPNIWNDVDGQYRGRDGKIHAAFAPPGPPEGGSDARSDHPKEGSGNGKHRSAEKPGESDTPPLGGAGGGSIYTVFSLWDTYRACNPLYTILEPKRTRDFIQTFLRQYEQGGLLPVWELAANETDCMIGNHAIPVIVDAYMKGIVGHNGYLELEAMVKSANSDRYGLKWYRELGYVPADKEPESVSKTLEYAYDDWCISLMAHRLRKVEIRDEFNRRAHNFMNVFDPSTRFFRAKNNATWQAPFDPFEVNFNFTEANAWQYRFAVPQVAGGMIWLMGGYKNFTDQLDSLFSASPKTTGRNQADITGLIGQYAHGNEPSHHVAYLYSEAGQPWKTQKYVRQIMDEMYSNSPDGLIGNEDCGQMSAWFVFSAMGFYPQAPGTTGYTIGTPLFERITLRLDQDKTFIIEAPNVSKTRCYVKRVTFRPEERGSIRKFDHILFSSKSHNKLIFEMSDTPATGAWDSVSPWNIYDTAFLPVPFVAKGERIFRDTQTIILGSLKRRVTHHVTNYKKDISDEIAIFYTLDGSIPTEQSARYVAPVKIDKTTTINFRAIEGNNKSHVATAVFTKISSDIRLHRYNTRYSPQYTARGDNGLIDGIRGGADFRTGDWQGFEGANLDVVLDLGKQQTINKISAGFMQDENAWIFFPTKMQVEISDDGQNFRPAGEVVCDVAPTEKGVLQKDFALEVKGEKARYVRVIGVSLVACPEWHKGAGHPCWVFTDEVLVE